MTPSYLTARSIIFFVSITWILFVLSLYSQTEIRTKIIFGYITQNSLFILGTSTLLLIGFSTYWFFDFYQTFQFYIKDLHGQKDEIKTSNNSSQDATLYFNNGSFSVRSKQFPLNFQSLSPSNSSQKLSFQTLTTYPTISLNFLPLECLEYILSFLTIKDLCTLSQTCLFWNKLCSQDHIWLKLYLKNWKIRKTRTKPSWKEEYCFKSMNEKNLISGEFSIHTYRGHQTSVYCLQFDLLNQKLISGSGDACIKVWDTKSKTCNKTIKAHNGPVHSLHFMNDLLVTGGGDSVVKLWDLEDLSEEPKTFIGHSSWVQSVQIFDDGRYLISGGGDKTVKTWDTETGQQISNFMHDGSIKRILVENTSNLCYNFKNQDSSSPIVYERNSLFQGASVFFTAVSSGKITIWDLKKNSPIQQWKAHLDSVQAIDYDTENQRLISGGLFFIFKTKKKIFFFFVKVKSSFHDSFIGSDRVVKIWDLRKNDFENPLKVFPHPDRLYCVELNPDSHKFLTVSYDGTIYVWNSETLELTTNFKYTNIIYW